MTNAEKLPNGLLTAPHLPIETTAEQHARIDRGRTSPRLFGLAGSLRKGSYSLATLRGLQHELDIGVLTIGDLRLPLYDADQDGEPSPAVIQKFRNDIAASDGLILVTPEYNHGVPGVLKNALDWASRPRGAAVLTDKPVLLISVGVAFTGGVRAQAQLHETLLAVRARLVLGPQVVIGNIDAKTCDGRLVDRAALDFALGGVNRLIQAVRLRTA